MIKKRLAVDNVSSTAISIRLPKHYYYRISQAYTGERLIGRLPIAVRNLECFKRCPASMSIAEWKELHFIFDDDAVSVEDEKVYDKICRVWRYAQLHEYLESTSEEDSDIEIT